MRCPVLIFLCLGALAAGQAPDPTTGSLAGELRVGWEGVALTDLGPLVVYLEATTEVDFPVPEEVAEVSQKNAQFAPKFLVVVAGQTVDWPNDDSIVHNVFSYSEAKTFDLGLYGQGESIVHNVFSYSEAKTFDLGLYGQGESKQVTFEVPGVVKVYCSIHNTMNMTLLVVPTPFFAVVGRDGSFAIDGVPAGSYRARLWNAKLPGQVQDVEIVAGGEHEASFVIGDQE